MSYVDRSCSEMCHTCSDKCLTLSDLRLTLQHRLAAWLMCGYRSICHSLLQIIAKLDPPIFEVVDLGLHFLHFMVSDTLVVLEGLQMCDPFIASRSSSALIEALSKR